MPANRLANSRGIRPAIRTDRMHSSTTTVTLAIALLVSSAAQAGSVADAKKRAVVDEAATKAAADIKDCGVKFTVQFDWKSYDAIDWKKIGRDKMEFMSSEAVNLEELGIGINQLCADKDYKAELAKTRTIIYKPTNDDTITLKAATAGGKLILSNYSFGSTRRKYDYEVAVKAAL
jgi:hypothetical protein